MGKSCINEECDNCLFKGDNHTLCLTCRSCNEDSPCHTCMLWKQDRWASFNKAIRKARKLSESLEPPSKRRRSESTTTDSEKKDPPHSPTREAAELDPNQSMPLLSPQKQTSPKNDSTGSKDKPVTSSNVNDLLLSSSVFQDFLKQMKDMSSSLATMQAGSAKATSTSTVVDDEALVLLAPESEESDDGKYKKRDWQNERVISDKLKSSFHSQANKEDVVFARKGQHTSKQNKRDVVFARKGQHTQDTDSDPDDFDSSAFLKATNKSLSDKQVVTSQVGRRDREDNDEWEEDDDSGAHATFKAAIAAVYELIPSLPRPQPKTKGKLQPLSHMPGDLETDDKSLYRFFPESPLVKECLTQIHEHWWEKPTEQADLTEPKTMPANAMYRPADLRKLPLAGYKDVFYKDPNAYLQLDPPEVGHHWQSSIGPNPRTVNMDYKAFLHLEKTMRRVAAGISSMDILMAALRTQAAKMPDLSEQDRKAALAVNAKLTNSLTLAISHSASFAVRAVADCVGARRKATLAVAKRVEISDPTKTWLMCQPLGNKALGGNLFGPVVPTVVKESTSEIAELRRGFAQLAKPHPSPNFQSGRGRGNKRQYDHAYSGDYNRGRGHNYRGRGRGRGGRGGRGAGGKSTYTFPPPSATVTKPDAPSRS